LLVAGIEILGAKFFRSSPSFVPCGDDGTGKGEKKAEPKDSSLDFPALGFLLSGQQPVSKKRKKNRRNQSNNCQLINFLFGNGKLTGAVRI